MHSSERSSAMNKLVKKDSQWPNIESMVVVFILNHFWSHVLESSTKCVSLLHVIRLNTPPKITNLDDIALFDQNIFWFNISMNNSLYIQIVYTRTDLNEKVECCVFAQILFFSNKIEKITFRGILQSKVNCGLVLERGVESTNILVI